MRASPLAAALSRMGIGRSPSASRVAVSDMVFEPTPAEGFFGKPVVEKECEQLWAGIKNYVLDHHLQPGHTDDAKLSKKDRRRGGSCFTSWALPDGARPSTCERRCGLTGAIAWGRPEMSG